MEQTTITQTQAQGKECYAISIDQTDYYFLYSAAVGNMPKIIQVTIDGVDIPIHYELSDVVNDATGYALGLEENRLSGVLVCIGKSINTKDFHEKTSVIIKSINNAIEQAIDHGSFNHEWEKPTDSEVGTMSVEIASHFYRINLGARTSSTSRYAGKPNNRRYPHTCVITHVDNDDPMADDPVEDDPMEDDDPMADDPMADDSGDNGNSGNSGEGGSDDESGRVVTVYDSICRSEAKHTTNATGKVIASTRRVSVPLTIDDWEKREYKPVVGDRIKVCKGSVAVEWGQILDFMPGTMGTTILFEFVA